MLQYYFVDNKRKYCCVVQFIFFNVNLGVFCTLSLSFTRSILLSCTIYAVYNLNFNVRAL